MKNNLKSLILNDRRKLMVVSNHDPSLQAISAVLRILKSFNVSEF